MPLGCGPPQGGWGTGGGTQKPRRVWHQGATRLQNRNCVLNRPATTPFIISGVQVLAQNLEVSMKLWLLTQNVNNDYDTYDSCVVAAFTQEQAKDIAPSGAVYGQDQWDLYNWCEPTEVTATLIGDATVDIKYGEVICSSFNAG